MHAEPVGHAVQDGPHALPLLVASTHDVPQSVKPALHTDAHVPPEHAFVAFDAVTHAAHWPPQQIPAPQREPLAASPVATHTDCPESQEVTPIWQTLPPGVHVVPVTHGPQAPAKHT